MTQRSPAPRIAAALSLGLSALAAGTSQGTAGPSPDDDAGLYFLMFGEAPPAASPDDELLVASIEAECPASLDRAYVLSFARPLRPGDRLRAAELDARLAAIADKMSLSDMFYGSSAAYERLEDGAGEDGLVAVRVTLRAEEGAWWAIGFAPWDLSIGYRNLGGGGRRVRATAGLDEQAIGYADPSIAYGPWYLAAAASREVRRRGGGIDPSYLFEDLSLSAELGLNASDDAAVGLALGYSAYRSPEEYFMYPDFEPPAEAALSALGLSSGLEGLASAGLRLRLGSLSYRERGGLRGSAVLELDALFPSAAWPAPVPRASALASLRYDAPELLRVTLRERITYLPSTAQGRVPEALWAGSADLRLPGALRAGELSSASRVGLALDRVASLDLGFVEAGIVPELFYELAVVQRRAYGPDPLAWQDAGFLVKADFPMPVGASFALGFAFGLAGGSDSRISLVFEVE